MNKVFAYRSSLFTCFFILILLGCATKRSRKIPETSNQFLSRYLTEAPTTILSMDNLAIDTLHIRAKDILGQKHAPSLSDSAFIGGITGMVKIENRLYVADNKRECLWMVKSNDGRLIRKIGRKGKGPGEFVSLQGIYKNSRRVFTIDMGTARINVYDQQLRYKTSFSNEFSGLQMGMAVTDSLLFLPTGYSRDSLFRLRRAVAPFTKLTYILPKIVGQNIELRNYNLYNIDSDQKGGFVFGFAGLPYLLIYNKQLEHVHTLWLRLDRDKDRELIPLEPTINKEGNKYKTLAFFSGIFLMNNGAMIMLRNGNLYFISYLNHKYRLSRILYLKWQDPRLKEGRPHHLYVSNVLVDHDTLYASSIFSPFIFRIPKINQIVSMPGIGEADKNFAQSHRRSLGLRPGG